MGVISYIKMTIVMLYIGDIQDVVKTYKCYMY